jgi:uncharacterized SAM-dependent methyltransferase
MEATVLVHESEFPEANMELLKRGLKERDMSAKFLYQSHAQTARWLALHRAYSPALLDQDCTRIYEEAFDRATGLATEALAHVASIGCGSGQKDTQLLRALRQQGKTVLYTPVDTSLAMVLTAQTTARSALRGLQCHPLVLDLPACTTMPALLKGGDPVGSQRFMLFLGMLHTFEAREVLPRLVNAVRSQDLFVVSANMAPENGYDEAMERILPQYDNALTQEWLWGALLELGFRREDGAIKVRVVKGEKELKRFEARFEAGRDCEVSVGGELFGFKQGESMRLFFSYRYHPRMVESTLRDFEIEVMERWVTRSEEEGVFLCKRAGKGSLAQDKQGS